MSEINDQPKRVEVRRVKPLTVSRERVRQTPFSPPRLVSAPARSRRAPLIVGALVVAVLLLGGWIVLANQKKKTDAGAPTATSDTVTSPATDKLTDAVAPAVAPTPTPTPVTTPPSTGISVTPAIDAAKEFEVVADGASAGKISLTSDMRLSQIVTKGANAYIAFNLATDTKSPNSYESVDEVWRVSLASDHKLQQVFAHETGGEFFSVSADETRIAYRLADDGAAIRVGDVGTRAHEKKIGLAANGAGYDAAGDATFSPEGDEIAFSVVNTATSASAIEIAGLGSGANWQKEIKSVADHYLFVKEWTSLSEVEYTTRATFAGALK